MTLQTPQLSNWQPPNDFKEITSGLPGITVFAPRPADVRVEAETTYKCPNCGASTRFDVSAGGIACESCGYVAPSKAQKVGKAAGELEFTLETLKQAQQGWGTTHKELHCDSCGANLSIPEGALTITCPFCASNKVNVRVSPSDHLRPRFLIPFKIKPEDLRNRALEWLGKGWFHPKELSANAVIDRFAGIYLSFWTFTADIGSDWRAEVGYERQESYYDPASKTHRTRTVIDWRWRDGHAAINVTDLLIAGNQRVSHVILERLYPFNLNDLVVYAPDFLAGWQALAYDITLPDAWEQGKTIMREKAKKACYNQIDSHHVRNFSMTADFADEAWRYILLPVYLAAYKFEDKVFQVMVNGQTGTVAGQKPVAWWKIWLALAGLLAPGIVLGLIGLPLLLAGGAGIVPIGIGLILLTIGGIIAYKVYQQAVASEAS
jgi:DNA-directed RNA polymerase subunit RPC12/RpoP